MTAASKFHGIEKIVSGGQTGVDRGALDAAIELGIPHGGWCPKGRLSEDGSIPQKYQLAEMDSSDYSVRTEQNVIDSDGTLILYRQKLQGGTLLTHRLAKRHDKPLLRMRLDLAIKYDDAVRWIIEHEIQTLNVAGPRGSSHPELESEASEVLRKLLTHTSFLSDC